METDIEASRKDIPVVSHQGKRNWALILVVGVLFVAVFFAGLFWGSRRPPTVKTEQQSEEAQEGATSGGDIIVSPELLNSGEIIVEPASTGAIKGLWTVAGVVETDQQRVQQISPLVPGIVDWIGPTQGEYVQKGQLIAKISSPQVAELFGKLHEAQNRLYLANRNLERTRQNANKVAIFKAEADLEQAEATVNRVSKLVSGGVAPAKDLIAAQTEFRRAKAELDFQKNVSLNRELAAAEAEAKTAQVEVYESSSALKATGARVDQSPQRSQRSAPVVEFKAPMSGIIVERLFNPGSGVEAGKPILTIADISSVWVVANVPETDIQLFSIGQPAMIQLPGANAPQLIGRIDYIDPRLNLDTRTARVRITVANANQALKAGMFVSVSFEQSKAHKSLRIPVDAVQRINERPVVFLSEPKEPGHFKVKEVEIGSESDGFFEVKSGLKEGDPIAVKGTFQLKSVLMKSSVGDSD